MRRTLDKASFRMRHRPTALPYWRDDIRVVRPTFSAHPPDPAHPAGTPPRGVRDWRDELPRESLHGKTAAEAQRDQLARIAA